jgi:asparagine synthase (glutamine-hydrolysing)
MCGIAGFAGLQLGQADARAKLRTMCDAIRHRGPDSDGYFVDAEVAMGMRRLSIIDVEGGHQPISNEDGTITVVFNGEIYNHHVLRQRLLAAGHRFRTKSDTEVLVHLYEEAGPDMARELQGMFAFSIWDAKQRRLFMARDRTGMKPLSYMQKPDGGLIYCSELRSLLALLPESPSISAASVMQYLAFGYVPDPNTIFEGVSKLPPGHLLEWHAGEQVRIRQYWKPPVTDRSNDNEPEIVSQLRAKLDHAVASHLESEVPLGAFLSGGLDSSTVVALMCRHASGRVKTFSIGFQEADFDESPAARAVAKALGTQHTELIVQPDVEDIFEHVVAMFDEPFGDASAIPTFLVAQLARQSVTVALSGDGGDELFGGYTRYRESLQQRQLPGPLAAMASTLGAWLPHTVFGRNRLLDLGRTHWGRYAARVLLPVRPDEGGVGAMRQPNGSTTLTEQFGEHLAQLADDDFAASMMRLDLQTYLPGDILTKVDRTSMAVSLEARVPLLDFDLVDYALTIPGALRVNRAEGKRLFRRAILGMIPDFLFTMPKRGFGVPLVYWFRGPLRHHIEKLRTPSAAVRPYLDVEQTQRIVKEHLAGRRDHSAMLWRLIVLDRWLEAFARGDLARSPSLPNWEASGRVSLDGHLL